MAVAEIVIANTAVAETAVADTAVAETAVADTAVAEIAIADGGRGNGGRRGGRNGQKRFEGVDVSDVNRYLTSAEISKLGTEGRAHLKAEREQKKNRNVAAVETASTEERGVDGKRWLARRFTVLGRVRTN